jgi:murein DD-endopeptidase MepM/ murein hydrolase activator NlpD
MLSARLAAATLMLLPLVACQAADQEQSRMSRADVRLLAEATTVQSVVPRNATIESLLRQQQLTPELAASVVDAVGGVFNPRELRANQTYWVTRTLDGLFREFRYQINADELLRVVFRAERTGTEIAPFDVERVVLPKEYVRSAVAAEITPDANSLIAAFRAHGENQLLPLQLAEVFSGDVDFNSDLRQGDRFQVLVDRVIRSGEFAGYGDIQAAVVETGGRRLTAFRFTDSTGRAAFYDENGQSLRRQFLRTPLPFDPRITSGFSYNRFHPVHGTRRPHLGVDFGAPTGTRVLAVASGTVTTAGWAGEAGRLVRIKHTGGYETLYLHLNGFAPGIRPGVRVDQGQVIGYVGASGTATGPHLDYRVVRNGTYLNPMTAFSSLPAGEPIGPDRLPEFAQVRDVAIAMMAAQAGAVTGD